jgi:putative hydrolases of HD superfamily
MTADDARNVAAFLTEAGHLKRTPRAGWLIAGIKDPESVAEHSYRTAVIGYVLAVMEGADPDRTAALCVFHDVPEARSGDIPSTGKRYVHMASGADIAKDQTADLPGPIAEAVRALVGEFDARETPEARCAKDADKLECLFQAREYLAQGNPLVQPWVDTMVAAVRTESGKRIAEAARTAPVDAWWYEIVASYGAQPADPLPDR